jgi:UDP-N-acetylglucosamine enolpyruvyl transferase
VDKLIVEGGRPLAGEVACAGSKNSVLPILAASLLTSERMVVENAPDLSDVDTMRPRAIRRCRRCRPWPKRWVSRASKPSPGTS